MAGAVMTSARLDSSLAGVDSFPNWALGLTRRSGLFLVGMMNRRQPGTIV